MPKPIVAVVSNTCGLSFETAEKRWAGAKKAAGDRKDDMKYVMGIFKYSLGKECIAKLVKKEGWKPVKWEEEMSQVEKLTSVLGEIMRDSLNNKPEGCV